MFEVVAGRRSKGISGLSPGILSVSAGLHALLLLGASYIDPRAGPMLSGAPPDETVVYLRLPPVQKAAIPAARRAAASSKPAVRPAARADESAPPPLSSPVETLDIPAELAEIAALDAGSFLPVGTEPAAEFVPRALALMVEEKPTNASPPAKRNAPVITDGSLLSAQPALLNGWKMRRTLRNLYSDSLNARGIEGQALVGFEIERDGKVDLSTFDLIYASHPEFAAAVLEGVKQLRFAPARLGGWPVRVRVHLPVRWKLPKNGSRN